jgi:hypothetical protein
MNGAVSLLPHKPSWHAQDIVSFTFTLPLRVMLTSVLVKQFLNERKEASLTMHGQGLMLELCTEFNSNPLFSAPPPTDELTRRKQQMFLHLCFRNAPNVFRAPFTIKVIKSGNT